jgi:hypothetical protein
MGESMSRRAMGCTAPPGIPPQTLPLRWKSRLPCPLSGPGSPSPTGAGSWRLGDHRTPRKPSEMDPKTDFWGFSN